jgi:hypothetical protein
MDFRLNLFLTFILASVLTLCLYKTPASSMESAAPLSAISYTSDNFSTGGKQVQLGSRPPINCGSAGVAACYQALSTGAPDLLQPHQAVDLNQQMASLP